LTALLEVRGLAKHFPFRGGVLGRRRGSVRAVDGVDLAVEPGECYAVVGESGSGKTTLGRCALRLIEPTAGSVRFAGEDLLALSPRELRRRRRRFQMVFQDPSSSLNPRMRVGSILGEPLDAHGLGTPAERRRRVAELLETVDLPAAAADRYPHELSGGQRQRVGIGRALATAPDLLVADEPVSALDVSVRAQVVNLLARLQQRFALTLVFIAHDLAVVEQIADRVAVVYLGRVVERGARAAVFGAPQHPYTVSLLSAVPAPDPRRRRRRIVLAGEPPSPAAPPAGCPFHPRCPIARARCAVEVPPLAEVRTDHAAACFYPGELTLAGAAAAASNRNISTDRT
jgi:peptide/nickel transport system ATP-binding protein